jgi:hypothetical protein
MTPEQRREYILLARGLLQIIGIIVVIAIGLLLWSVRHGGVECFYQTPDGEKISTGLYGNCTWMQNQFSLLGDKNDTRNNQ